MHNNNITKITATLCIKALCQH